MPFLLHASCNNSSSCCMTMNVGSQPPTRRMYSKIRSSASPFETQLGVSAAPGNGTFSAGGGGGGDSRGFRGLRKILYSPIAAVLVLHVLPGEPFVRPIQWASHDAHHHDHLDLELLVRLAVIFKKAQVPAFLRADRLPVINVCRSSTSAAMFKADYGS